MTPDELKRLRTQLGYSTRELAKAIGVEQSEVLSWERGETFPTKKWVDRMASLPPTPEKPRRAAPPPTKSSAQPTIDPALLTDPLIWSLIRKLLIHDELRARALLLAAEFPDPTDDK